MFYSDQNNKHLQVGQHTIKNNPKKPDTVNHPVLTSRTLMAQVLVFALK